VTRLEWEFYEKLERRDRLLWRWVFVPSLALWAVGFLSWAFGSCVGAP
jgi:hypothetical protein